MCKSRIQSNTDYCCSKCSTLFWDQRLMRIMLEVVFSETIISSSTGILMTAENNRMQTTTNWQQLSNYCTTLQLHRCRHLQPYVSLKCGNKRQTSFAQSMCQLKRARVSKMAASVQETLRRNLPRVRLPVTGPNWQLHPVSRESIYRLAHCLQIQCDQEHYIKSHQRTVRERGQQVMYDWPK